MIFVWLNFAINVASPKLEKRVTALDALGQSDFIFGEKNSGKNLSGSDLDITFPLTFLLVDNAIVKKVLQQNVAKLVRKKMVRF